MGFPERFIEWLKTLYSKCTLSPLNGGAIVGNIEDVGSLRQGCPLSVHLFTLYIEPLIAALHNNLEGIYVHSHKVAVRAFVDDLTVIVKSDSDILRACELVEAFCSWTHMRVNKTKSKLLGIGDWAFDRQLEREKANIASSKSGVPFKKWPVLWLEPVKSLKLLGINFTASIKETEKLEWAKMCHKMLGVLLDNGDRKLTLLGRVLFYKQHVLALATHLAQVIPCPDTVSDRIRAHMTSFVWRGHIKPNRNASLRDKRKGGLGVPNIQLFFRSLFSHRICKSITGPEGPEKAVLRYWFALHLHHLFPDYIGPKASGELPDHVRRTIPVIKALSQQNIISTVDAASHRKIYSSFTAAIEEPGRIELKRPNLNWDRIWRWVATTKGKNRDILFLLNHELLPTNERKRRRSQTSSPLCPMCHLSNEDNLHLMLWCPYRGGIASWLERMLRSLGCRVSLQDAIHGHIGDCPNPRETFGLLEAYITEIWRQRKTLSVPPVSGLEALWQTLLKKS